MKFIQVDKKPEKDAQAAGKVDFVEYMVHFRGKDMLVSLWPNGFNVNGRAIAVVGKDIKHAWDSVLNSPKITSEFGIV